MSPSPSMAEAKPWLGHPNPHPCCSSAQLCSARRRSCAGDGGRRSHRKIVSPIRLPCLLHLISIASSQAS
jgi:hypothetical protein